MMNRAKLISAQTWVTKTVNQHSTYPDLFAGSHLLTAQKSASECYVIERFIEIRITWCSRRDARRKDRTENLR